MSRADRSDVENLGAWLTTVTARVCLNMLQSRRSRREEPLGPHVPDPLVGREDGLDPEHATVLADMVGLALLVVLDSLTPAERLAFVLHDVFAVPFDDIAPIVGRSSPAARQLASRARRRVQRSTPVPNVDLAAQRAVVDAFFAAAHHGDFDALVAVLDPDVVLRSDGGVARPGATFLLRGAATVAGSALSFAKLSPFVRPALVNGAAGVIVAPRGRPFSIMSFTVRGRHIVEINSLADPNRLRRLDLAVGPE
jgi:RNA polymerase sigma-70 factor (ECF subfamily)